MLNMDAARRVHDELGADIVVIKKPSEGYGREKNPPPCPSVMVNGRIIVMNDTVTYEELKSALRTDREQ